MGPINLEKIRQVHQEMMRRETEFAADKERCDWLDETRSSVSLIYKSDGQISSFQAKFGPPGKLIARAKCKIASSSSVMRLNYNGMSKTIAEWSQETGLPDATIRNRLRLGWSITDTLSKSNVRDDYKPHQVDPIRIARTTRKRHERGDHSKTLQGWADDAGIKRSTVATRMSRGLSLEDAISVPVQSRTAREQPIGLKARITFRDQVMTLEDWARHFSISPYTVMNRLRQGWEVEPALVIPPRAVLGKNSKGGGWSKTSTDYPGTGGVGSLDTKPKQDFFE